MAGFSVMVGCIFFIISTGRADDCNQAAQLSSAAGQMLGHNSAGAEERLIEAVTLCPKSAALIGRGGT